ncbi:DUF4080 domain-containing protein, partial [Lachnotalea glycerini]
DLYLRENLKSRPNWAADLTEYKDIIKSFYVKEEKERIFLPEYKDYNYKQLGKMTHIEVFSAKAITKQNSNDKVMLLFDYNKRNPLTYEAHTQMVGVLK